MKETFAKRGFVTIATGHERYYKLAQNLLHSYRYGTKEPVPFAIIADRENEYTAEFDHVIVISDPDNSYNDKLKLFRELPYEETIFIDADSLAYGDLNAWWDIFEKAGDFSLFGYAWRDLHCGRGWFVPAGMKEFQKDISFIPDFNGGVYYMRNTEACKRVFEIANHCAAHYSEYQFNGFSAPADEPVLALGMAACGMEPVNLDGELIFAPNLRQLKADITKPKAVFYTRGGVNQTVRIIHFSNYRTQLSFYRSQVKQLDRCIAGKPCYRWQETLRYAALRVYDIVPFAGRVKRKLRKLLS